MTLDEELLASLTDPGEFLSRLDAKLHKRQPGKYCGIDVYADVSTEASMTPREAQRLIKIVKEDGLLMYPVNMDMGFRVGFVVGAVVHEAPGIEPSAQSLVQFSEKQLPRGYTFQRLSQIFLKPENLEKMKFCGLEPPVGDRSRYDY